MSNDMSQPNERAIYVLQFPVSPNGRVQFEVTLIDNVNINGLLFIFGVGLAQKGLTKMVGWYDNSLGMHSDDGGLFIGTNATKEHTGPTFSYVDTVGFIWEENGDVYFTHNTVKLPQKFFRHRNANFLPSVSWKQFGTRFKVNSGQAPFVYQGK